jgi:hypothetical protein
VKTFRGQHVFSEKSFSLLYRLPETRSGKAHLRFQELDLFKWKATCGWSLPWLGLLLFWLVDMWIETKARISLKESNPDRLVLRVNL